MEKKIYEHGKRRTISIDRGYIYQEDIKANPDDEDYIEFLSLCKSDDYSFMYFNGTFEEKVGIFTIENDSAVITPFLNLIKDDKTFKVTDDYSERFIEFSKNEKGEVQILFHLLPGETDGSIELKNIMFDLRSQADRDGSKTKERLSVFFDELIELMNNLEPETGTKLAKKPNYPNT